MGGLKALFPVDPVWYRGAFLQYLLRYQRRESQMLTDVWLRAFKPT